MKNISKKPTADTAIFPLATFRVVFGALMLFSTLRFWYNGWIEDFYLAPSHFFSYFGLDWILPYGPMFIYSLFIIMAVSALGIMLGLFFRVSSLLFFLSFTYVELIDKTTYLNHYYFVSLMAFLLLVTPAHRAFSLDSKVFPRIKSFTAPRWSILALQFQIVILYFYAGIAKLNYDWLFEAQPMSIWLQSKAGFPLIGQFLALEETAFIFSWAGMLFDISIAFLLFSRKLRPLGYLAVIAFHMLTWVLFPIGVFPWVMIGVTLIFFSSEWHENLWDRVSSLKKMFRVWGSKFAVSYSNPPIPRSPYPIRMSLREPLVLTRKNKIYNLKNYGLLSLLALHFFIQLAIPLRHHISSENLYWTENGYRFSWRVMLMEKTGFLEFKVKDIVTQKESIVQPCDYFTAFQQRQLVTQPDMILQAARVIANDYKSRGIQVEVFADSYASLNGDKHRPFVNPEINLVALKNEQKRDWIIQYD